MTTPYTAGGVPVQIEVDPGVVAAGGKVHITLKFETAQPSGTKVYLSYHEAAPALLSTRPPYEHVSGTSHEFDITTNSTSQASGSVLMTANLGNNYAVASFYVRA